MKYVCNDPISMQENWNLTEESKRKEQHFLPLKIGQEDADPSESLLLLPLPETGDSAVLLTLKVSAAALLISLKASPGGPQRDDFGVPPYESACATVIRLWTGLDMITAHEQGGFHFVKPFPKQPVGGIVLYDVNSWRLIEGFPNGSFYLGSTS